MIKARVIADSVSPAGARIISWILTYPRFIHAEFMTHRVFSRNAASSRAIPIEKMLKTIEDHPAEPEFWGKNQSGMQANTELEDVEKISAQWRWRDAKAQAIASVKGLHELNVHKQIANRITEPWAHITVMATGTDYLNFFNLRAHKDAQPEFQVLAYTMLREYLRSVSVKVEDGWHIPFGDRMPEGLTLQQRLKIATARAARVSYNTFDGEINPEKDYELHDRLAASGHWSPFEHCACALPRAREVSGNFHGWQQYRKSFKTENASHVKENDLARIYANMPLWVHNSILRNDAITTE